MLDNELAVAMSRRAVFRAGSAVAAGLALDPRLAWAAAPSSATRAMWPNVAAMVDGYVDSGKLPEMLATLGWGARAPEVIAKGKEGLDDADPVGIDSLYRLYSMTKPITGMAAMILIDEGRMKLDQPLADILPKFAKMQVQATPDGSLTELVPAQSPITIRNLLTHTAGLGYSIIQKGPLKGAFEDAGVIAGQVSRTKIPGFDRGTPVTSLETFADRLAGLPLVYQPGTQWSYSVGLDLMGRVIEVVSGQSFDSFLQERIFGPTGMTSSYFRVPAAQEKRLTSNYGVIGKLLLPLDPAKNSIFLGQPPFPMGGAGLVSSPRDYDRFMNMLTGFGRIGGKRVMSEAAVRLGTSNLMPPSVSTKGTWMDGQGFGAGGRVGLGEQAGVYGWGGAAGTVAFVDMRRSLRAGLYTQYMPDSSYPVHEQFPKAVVADLTKRKAGA
ncbi:serine hydrolase domain-containing protein [Novosphingobium tardum]|uniref:Serine hydrolase domain-containing protein n=1 Tax=Novosphingobium tardum TaxID=1538021 RepID=A0ABV8RT89_9SPHN